MKVYMMIMGVFLSFTSLAQVTTPCEEYQFGSVRLTAIKVADIHTGEMSLGRLIEEGKKGQVKMVKGTRGELWGSFRIISYTDNSYVEPFTEGSTNRSHEMTVEINTPVITSTWASSGHIEHATWEKKTIRLVCYSHFI